MPRKKRDPAATPAEETPAAELPARTVEVDGATPVKWSPLLVGRYVGGPVEGTVSGPAPDPFDALAAAAVTDPDFAAGLKRKRIGPAHVLGVMRGLRRNGFGAVALAAWLPIVVQLLVALGPLIAEIIERIRQAKDAGETPATFSGTM